MDDSQNSLVPVHVCYSDGEADVVMAFLRANEIDAVSSSRIDHSVFPVTADGLAEVQVSVAVESAEAARALLAEYAATEPSDSGESDSDDT
jgi:hypothetical protein